MYRGGSRVDLARSSPTSFYGPANPTRSEFFPSPVQQDDNFQTASLHHKMDQLLSIITSTQRVLVDQQASSKRLEDKVEKLSEEVFFMTGEIDELKSSTPENNKSSPRSRLPTELSVGQISVKNALCTCFVYIF